MRFGDGWHPDLDKIVEAFAQEIEASKIEPLCLRCDDTGLIENSYGWGEPLPCNCKAGRS